jgi:hypothetical protein
MLLLDFRGRLLIAMVLRFQVVDSMVKGYSSWHLFVFLLVRSRMNEEWKAIGLIMRGFSKPRSDLQLRVIFDSTKIVFLFLSEMVVLDEVQQLLVPSLSKHLL